MTIQNTLNKTYTIDGKTNSQNITVNSNSTIRREITLNAAKVGLLTRTDADTGTLTMNSGHGITTAAKLDVYWTESGIAKNRRNMTVGTVVTNSVPIDGGSGDNLPTGTGVAITAMIPSSEEFRFDGDDMKILVVTANAVANIVIAGADDAEDAYYGIQQAGQVKDWYEGNGETNPLAGDTETQLIISHGDSSGSKTIKVTVGIA